MFHSFEHSFRSRVGIDSAGGVTVLLITEVLCPSNFPVELLNISFNLCGINILGGGDKVQTMV